MCHPDSTPDGISVSTWTMSLPGIEDALCWSSVRLSFPASSSAGRGPVDRDAAIRARVELDRRGVLLADGDDAHAVLLGLVCRRTSTLRPPASTAHGSDDSGPSVNPTCGLAVSGSGSWRDATGRLRAAAPRCDPDVDWLN